MNSIHRIFKGEQSKAYAYLHFSVILYGFTAILGKLITLPGTSIVWYRMIITTVSLLFFPGILRKLRKLPLSSLKPMIGTGITITLHWIAFYEAIKYANASIVVSCMASVTLFTAFLEPLFLKRRVSGIELLLGLVVIGGFLFIFGFTGEKYLTGMIIAIISAFLAAFFSVWTKTFVHKHDPIAITFVQFISGLTFVSLLIPIYLKVFPHTDLIPTKMDIPYILVLSLMCTTLAYLLTMHALKVLTPFTVNLAITMEPVYGIIMAYFILHEDKDLNTGFYIGAALIIIAVSSYPFFKQRFKARAR